MGSEISPWSKCSVGYNDNDDVVVVVVVVVGVSKSDMEVK